MDKKLISDKERELVERIRMHPLLTRTDFNNLLDIIDKLDKRYSEEQIENNITLHTINQKIDSMKFTYNSDKNDKFKEYLKYHLGLKSNYQPPTGYKFYDDNSNEGIINSIVN